MELAQIGADVYACLQPDTGLGASNSGFVNVDELCDDDLDKLAVELQRLGKSSPIRPADPDSANERAQSTAAPRRSAPRAAAQKNHSVARRRSRGAGS